MASKIRIGEFAFTFNPPSEEQYDRFIDSVAGNRGNTAAAHTQLVKDCVTSPTGQELDAIFEKKPAVKHALAGKLKAEAGAFLEVEEGK